MKNNNVKTISIPLFWVIIIIAIIIGVIYFLYTTNINNDNKELSKNTENNKTSELIVEGNSVSNNDIIQNTNNNIVENEKLIVLYQGYTFDMNNHSDLENSIPFTESNKSKYEIKYYNYEEGNYLGESTGKLVQTYEGVSNVQNVTKIAMSKKYNAIPRKYTLLDTIPEELNKLSKYDNVKIHQIDLDGDGKLEFVACCQLEKDAQNSETGKYTNYSEIILFDSNYNEISKLAYSEDQYWENNGKITDKFMLSIKDVEYIDIDEDGIMEIIINLNVYEGIGIGVYKYNNGKIEGDINKKVIVLP